MVDKTHYMCLLYGLLYMPIWQINAHHSKDTEVRYTRNENIASKTHQDMWLEQLNLSPCFTECETCWLKTIRSVSCKCCKCWTSSEIYLSELFLLPSGDKIKETWFVVRIDKVKGKGTHNRGFKHNQVWWNSTWVISYHRIKL